MEKVLCVELVCCCPKIHVSHVMTPNDDCCTYTHSALKVRPSGQYEEASLYVVFHHVARGDVAGPTLHPPIVRVPKMLLP